MASPRIQSELAMALLVGVAIMASLWQPAHSHGRLMGPPARSSMWRLGFNTPTNYQDNELFCGGFSYQVNQGYKCGICGDPWDQERPHEAGGMYATGTIGATYNQGEEVVIQVQLTANHKGWFEFKICPTNDFTVKATQECLDLYPLDLSDGSGTKLDVTGKGSTMISIPVMLPEDLVCDFCVLQWHYHTGNSWGTDPDGRSCVGCGYQEEFYGCADIKILPSTSQEVTTVPPTAMPSTTPTVSSSFSTNWGSLSSSTFRSTHYPTSSTFSSFPSSTFSPSTSGTSSSGGSSNSHGTSPPPPPATTTTATDSSSSGVVLVWSCRSKIFLMDLVEWCNTNCNLGYCPASHCECDHVPEPRASEEANLPAGCYAKTPFVTWPGMDAWCSNNCVGNTCPDGRCFCKSL